MLVTNSARLRSTTPARHLLVALVLVFATVAASPGAAAGPPTGSGARAGAPSPDELRACFAGRTPETCLDGLFRRYLATHSTAEALRLLTAYEAAHVDLRLGCHPIVHAIGRETFRIKGTIHDAFAVCDGTCHSGCYHGAVERFLGGGTGGHVSQTVLEAKAAEICRAPASRYMKFQCLHGLGHALLYFSGYQLDTALAVCESLQDPFAQRSCYGGVFMENVAAAAVEKRDVSRTDYHYPCNRLNPKYGPDCYRMQTSRMTEMGLWPGGLFVECAKAGRFRPNCVESIGRDLSIHVRGQDRQWAADLCARRPAGDRTACIRGAVYALIDHSWDLRYALPFCAALHAGEDRAYCLRTSARYVAANRDASAESIERECRQHFAEGRVCRTVAEDATRAARGAPPWPHR